MKKRKLGNVVVKVIKELETKNSTEKWVQIEILEGKDKGMRKPVPVTDLEK
jgi:hypothetical protein